MGFYILKISLTTILVVLISEVAKRSPLIGAILASVPLISVLALLWLYIETQDAEKISALSSSIFWLVLPSLSFFITLPILLRNNIHFYLSLALSVGVTVACYWMMLRLLSQFGIK